MVASAPPATQQVTGRVASAGFGASASPARPWMAMRVELLVNSSAWHAASMPTLRWVLSKGRLLPWVLFIYTVSGADCNSRTNDQASRHAFADPGTVRDRRALAVRRRLGRRGKDRRNISNH